MCAQYDKPFKRYEELIALMRSRNIIVADEDFAVRAMSNMSYYTLVNGYKNTVLSIPGTDNFIPGTKFEELYTLHAIDVSIGNELLKYILYIEGSLKSKLSYLVSKKYGVYTDPANMLHNAPGDYLYRGYYSNARHMRNNTLKLLTETICPPPGSKRFQSPSLVYYRTHHNHIPPWILTTSITFGQAIMWYDILLPVDRTELCNCFLSGSPLSDVQKKEYIKKSLDLLREFRNIIAHGSRTILDHAKVSIPKAQIIALSQGVITESDYNSNPYAQSGLYAVMAVLITLLNDEYLMAAFVRELSFILTPYENVTVGGKGVYELFHLPVNILDRMSSYQV